MRIAGAIFLLLIIGGCDKRSVDAPTTSTIATPRLVALAPHLAELVFAAGAGDRLVAVSEYSDYPEAVKALPVIGDAFAVDTERLALIRPDVVLAWQSGTPKKTVSDLRERGYRVETVRTESLSDVAAALEFVGKIAGTGAAASAAASRYLEQIEELRRSHRDRPSIRVFYQISMRPLYTVNGSHYISELITLCGGNNVFSDLGGLAATVSAEAVLVRDPEVLLAGSSAAEGAYFEEWERWPELAANRFDNRFVVPAAIIGRASPRLAAAGSLLCERLDDARRNRAQAGVA